MSMMEGMLIGAGFTVTEEKGNRAKVSIGDNTATIVINDPFGDPIGKCKIITEDGEKEFSSIYDAAIYVSEIGKDMRELHYFFRRYIVVAPDMKCIVFTSDDKEECKNYIKDQLNPPEPLTETLRYYLFDTSEEADHPWYPVKFERIIEEDEE